MPAAIDSDKEIAKAVQSGKLTEARLDHVYAQLLNIMFKSVEAHKEGLKFDYEGIHMLARKISGIYRSLKKR
jgi:hypothetical protein